MADKGMACALGFVLAAVSAATGLVGQEDGAAPAAGGSTGALAARESLADHVARHYRVGASAATQAVNAAYMAAERNGVDPLLVLAVIGIESSFNAAAESAAGALGLMQNRAVLARSRARRARG